MTEKNKQCRQAARLFRISYQPEPTLDIVKPAHGHGKRPEVGQTTFSFVSFDLGGAIPLSISINLYIRRGFRWECSKRAGLRRAKP